MRRQSAPLIALALFFTFCCSCCPSSSAAQSNTNNSSNNKNSLLLFASPPEAPSLREAPFRPPPGAPLRVVARLKQIDDSAVQPNVSLTYLVGFQEPPTAIPMLPLESSDPLAFAADIPAAALAKGALLRWAATAATAAPGSSSSSSSSSYPAQSVRCPRRGDDWLGTVVLDPDEPSKLPLVEWFRAPGSSSGGEGNGAASGSGDWLWFDGTLRPLAAVSRKGTTSLGWPKPKLKLEFKKGYDSEEDGGSGGSRLVLRPPFAFEEEGPGGGAGGGGAAAMTSVDLDSLWWEPGSNSYVRQAAAFSALRSVAKAPALLTRHVVVRRDGAFYGIHALTERPGAGWLRRERLLPPEKAGGGGGNGGNGGDGVSLYKPISASAALVPGVPPSSMPLVWKTEYGETRHGDIDDFARKLANGRARGGSSSSAEESAAEWLLEALDLPRTLNYLSTAAVLLQQDRCTKNWLLLQERSKDNGGGISRWSLLAGDSKTAMGADSGFGGEAEHARDYALNHSDQFASPLFCDRGHPQDVESSEAEPWSGVVVESIGGGGKVMKQSGGAAASDGGGEDGDGGGRRRRRRRRLQQRRRRRSVLTATDKAPATAESPVVSFSAPRIEPPPPNRPAAPQPLGCAADTTGLVRPDGSPPSTFNAVVDALLRCPATRAMFLRRCQTLTGQLHGGGGGGALAAIVGNLTSAVAADAARDDAAWRGGDPSLGARQLLEEQIPGRGRQMQEAYGKGGYVSDGLLPPPQQLPLPASAVRVAVFPKSSSSSSSSSGSGSSSSPKPLAAVSSASPEVSLDLSGYSLRVGAREVAFPVGTVSPPSGWVVLFFGDGGDGGRRNAPVSPALGTRLARDAGLSGLILTVEGAQQKEVAAAVGGAVVALVAPGGEVVVL